MTDNPQALNKIKAYLPKLIINAQRGANFSPAIDILEGALMFADISGFTAISEKLATTGKGGSEELTQVINKHLTGMVSVIIDNGGDILKFGGDATLVYFGECEAATRAAFEINNWAIANKTVKNSAGRFDLTLHTGLHYGKFFSAEIGDPETKLEHIVTGDALNEVFNAADFAEGEQVGATEEFCSKVEDYIRQGRSDDKYIIIEPKSEFRVTENLSTAYIPHDFNIDILSKFLPSGLHDKLSTGRDGWISAEHRRITIMFINYTVPGDHFLEAPEELKERLDRYYRMVNESISSMGGVITRVDCYSKGDKVLAVFGAVKAHQDDEARAVRAALNMQKGLNEINSETGWDIQHKIGINAGRAFCGDVGAIKRREYTVMGDDVNLAARLMSKAEINSILLGEKVKTKLDNLKVDSAGEVTVKGKSDPIPVYTVSDESLEETDLINEALSAHSGPMVGRKKEIWELTESIEQTLQGEFRSVIIRGEAGIGKSRLTARFLELSEQNGLPGYIGACQSYGGAIPFLPWKPIFEKILHVKGQDFDKELLHEISSESSLSEWEPTLNDILELGIPETPETKNLDTRIRHQRLFDLLHAILRYQANNRQYYVILEDVHWIDETSFEFLNYIFEEEPIKGLMMVSVTRPEHKIENSVAYRQSSLINLEALPPEESTELIISMLNIPDIPEEVQKIVIDKAQGNPFFAGEIIRSLKDNGFIKTDEDTGELGFVGDVKNLELPDNINSLVLSRIDRLPEASKDVIKTAAVIGRSFDLNLLESIFPYKVSRDALIDHLSKLASLDLTPIDNQGANPGYIFKHIMTQEVAYQCQSFSERETLHGRVGDKLESKYIDNLHPHLELLAHHYSHSSRKDKAFRYLIEAGDKAVSIFANGEAIRFYNGAEKMFSRPGRLPNFIDRNKVCHVIKAKANVYLRTGSYDDAEQAYKQLNNKLKRWEMHEQVPIVLNYIAESRWLKGEYDSALRAAKKGLRFSGKSDNLAGRASSVFSIAEIARRKGDFKTAAEKFRTAADIYHDINDDNEIASSLNSLGITLWAMGELDEALDVYLQALEIRNKLSDIEGEAKILNNLGLIYLDTGKIDLAMENIRKAADAFERVGDRRNRSYCLGNIGYVSKNLANYSDAEEAFTEALKVLERIGDTAGTAYTYSNLGDLYLQMYQPKLALDNHSKAIELAKSLGDEELISELLAGFAFDKSALADVESAHRDAKQAMEIGERIGAKIYTIKALSALVDTFTSHKDPDAGEAAVKLEELAKDDFSEYGTYAFLSLGKFYMSINQKSKSREMLQIALERAAKGGYKQLEWESRYIIGTLLTSDSTEKKFLKLGEQEINSARELIQETASKIKHREMADSFLSAEPIKKVFDSAAV
ncbi:MAG: tetratricopeptide repeat protein [candidate division Zixibacteria bacterium]|nr:tetratricopeptide repeat protein [candidate division Zixibacteria bacterium]